MFKNVNTREVLTLALSVLGVLLCSYGAYLVYPAAGFITAGLSCLVLELRLDTAKKERGGG